MTTVTSTVYCEDPECKGHRTTRVYPGPIVLTDDPEHPFAIDAKADDSDGASS